MFIKEKNALGGGESRNHYKPLKSLNFNIQMSMLMPAIDEERNYLLKKKKRDFSRFAYPWHRGTLDKIHF